MWIIPMVGGLSLAAIGALYLVIGWRAPPSPHLMQPETSAVVAILLGGFIAGFSAVMAGIQKWGKR